MKRTAMMVGGECPNCREYTNASTSRLVRDACGHRKCRMCLVYEEEGCKTCQSEHRIQMIGSFDYPVPSSSLVSVSVDSSADEKEDIVLQPLELVIHKTLGHDGDLFNQQESCGLESSACQSGWADDRDVGVGDISEGRNDARETNQGIDVQTSNENDCPITVQRHVTLDTENSCLLDYGPENRNDYNADFDADDQTIKRQEFVLPQTDAPNMEPLKLVTSMHSSTEGKGNQQDAQLQTPNICEKKEDQIDCAMKEKVQTPKRRKNCKLKRSHISVIPGIQESYKCNICNKTFKSATAQRYHDSCLTGVKPYQCTICDRSFVKQSHFQYHERTHTGYKPFECSFCGKAFPQRNKLNRHLHSHQNEKRFKCAICDKGYRSREDLKSHVNIHSGVMPYTCQVCKKSFREATNLTRHMHTHSNERPHMCEQCGKSFKDKSLLVRHRRTHGKDRPFACSDCARVFLSKSELSRHLAVHSDDKPFPCLFCSTVFRRKDNLNRHTRHHHSDGQIAPLEEKSKHDEEDTQALKLKPANVPKQKLKAKERPKAIANFLPKSPARISVLYLNTHEQINSRLDSRSNVIPVIRTTSELSNAVPVINGPISIKRPEETTNSPKKAFTHTEPIPLAEAVVINRRIEEKLYPKTNSNNDRYFRPDFRSRVERHSSVHKIRPLRTNKTISTCKIYSPERSFFEPRGSPAPMNWSLNKNHRLLENELTQSEIVTTLINYQDSKGINTPRYTVPKKRAIEELKSNPIPSISQQEGSSSSGLFEPERTNCVPTITKAGNGNSANDMKEFNLPNTVILDNEISNESRLESAENVEQCPNVKKLSDIHWRRRTSEILRPRMNGFNSSTDCQLSELEMTDQSTSRG